MKPKNNQPLKVRKASKTSETRKPSKSKIISCFLIAILLLFSGMDSAFLGDTARQGTAPQQITAQSENDPLTLSRISLEDRIEVAEALLRDTEVQENGKNTPSDKFWAPLEAHLALLNAINEAKALLAALQVHGLTIIAQDSDGQAIDQAEVTLTVDGVSTTHQAAMGIISVPEIPIGSTVILNAETEPDTPYAFLRWEVARGDVEISPFVPIPEIAMPYGMVVLYAIFEPTAEDTSWALLPVWDDNLADEPLEFTITEIGAYVDGFSEGVIVGKHSTDIEFTEHSESAEPPPYMPVDIEFTEYLELPPYEHEDYESHADYDDDIISAFDVRPVYPAAWNPNAFANSVIVDVDYGVPWSIELPSYAPWLTITNQRRNPPHTSDSFVINVLEHTGSSPRTAIVRLVLPYAFIEITVTQSSSAVLLVGTSSWTADASGDAIAIGVATTSNRRWEVTTNVPWLSLWDYEPSNRTGNGHFVIAADTHLGNASRMGLIIVTAGAATRTITVNQHPGAVLIVNTATATAGAWGGTSQPIDVISNRTWTVTSSSPSWLTATPASRTGNGSFTISAAMNAGLGTRTGIITVSTLGADSRSIIVTQESGGGLLLSWDEATAPADPSTGTVEVFSDRTWNMPTSNVSWLTVSNISPSHRTGNGSFAVNTSANLGNTARTGTITVTAGTTARTVRITQNTGGVLLLSWNTAEATAAPSYGILNVISNRAWSIHNGAAAWLSTTDITPTNQNGSGSFYINATENPSTSQRSGVIAVSSNGLSTQTARVVQAGQTAQISLAQNSWLPTSGASSTSLIVTSNTTWTATSNQSWLTLTPASRTGTGALTLVTSVNNSSTARTGTVTISANGAVSRTITVTQAGVTTFALNMNTWTPPSAAAFATVNVTASGTWNMPTSNASWLTISNITPTNRTGNGSFRINATANTSAAPRTGTITASLGGMTRTITVTQAAQAVQNPLNGVSWLMYYDSANNAEIYVTSATVPSYGTFRNVYMGMLRNMSGGGQSGALYAQTTSGWVHVGDLTFSEGVGGLSEGEIGSAHEDEITGFSQMTATVSGGGIFNFTRPTPLSTITNRPTLSGFFSWLFSYRIIFDANGGTVGTGTTLTKNVPQQSGGGSVVGTLPPTPRRLDFDFGGWFTTPNQTGGTQVTENTIVTGNTTYWARWIPQLNIDYPSFDGEILSRPAPHNIAIHWTQIPSATYTISLFNTSVGMYVFKDIPPFTADFGRIPYGYFYEGHEYEFTVNATIGSVVRTATRKFKIRLGSQRQTIINRALAMNSYKWTIPAEKSLVGWNTFLSENPTPNPYTFSPNNTYEGIPYTQSTQVTSHQSQVPWSVNAPLSFDEALNNRTNFFSTVDRYDGDVHIGYMPAYGTDCSGFVSIAIAPILAVDRELTTAPVERYTTAGLHSDTRFPRVRQDENESLRHRLARLSPGDFINASGNHTMIVYKIEPCDEIEGSLIVTTVEQSAYRPANSGPIVSGQRIWSNIRRTGRGEQAITSAHIGRVARSEMLQDYSWSWIE